METYVKQTHALGAAIVSQHSRGRAIVIHVLRFSGPLFFAFLLYTQKNSFRDMIVKGFRDTIVQEGQFRTREKHSNQMGNDQFHDNDDGQNEENRESAGTSSAERNLGRISIQDERILKKIARKDKDALARKRLRKGAAKRKARGHSLLEAVVNILPELGVPSLLSEANASARSDEVVARNSNLSQSLSPRRRNTHVQNHGKGVKDIQTKVPNLLSVANASARSHGTVTWKISPAKPLFTRRRTSQKLQKDAKKANGIQAKAPNLLSVANAHARSDGSAPRNARPLSPRRRVGRNGRAGQVHFSLEPGGGLVATGGKMDKRGKTQQNGAAREGTQSTSRKETTDAISWKSQGNVSHIIIGNHAPYSKKGIGFLADTRATTADPANVTATADKYVAEAIDLVYAEMVLITALLGMVLFVGKLAAERESGLHHLLHISGLLRSCFWAAEVNIEGVMQTFLELVIVTFASAFLLNVRVVLHSSWIVLGWALLLLVLSTFAMGCALHLLVKYQRVSNVLSVCLTLVFIFWCPAYWARQDELIMDTMDWKIMINPLLTSSSILCRLMKACSPMLGDGNCVTRLDIFDHTWIMPWEIVVGTNRWKDISPAGQVVGLSGVVVLQLGLFTLVVAFLDSWQFPMLQRSQSDAEDLHKNALKVTELEHEYRGMPFLQNCVKTLRGNLTFCLAPGAMLGLLGPNGAGKTTAIRCVTGEEKPLSGSVTFRPSKLNNQGLRLRSFGNSGGNVVTRHKTYVGLCPQETALADDLTVQEHLQLFARIRESIDTILCADEMLQIVKLQDKRNDVPAHLSGGMRRRLAIGICMVADPDVALLDEPTTGLDPSTRRNIWKAIMDARNLGTACLLTTHMLEEAEQLSTNIIILTQGEIAAQGTVQELKDEYSAGYLLSVDAKAGEETIAKAYISSLLPGAHKEPIHASMHGNMCFKVSKDAKFVGNLFLELGEQADYHGIRSWGISQANLEDAYLRIVNQP